MLIVQYALSEIYKEEDELNEIKNKDHSRILYDHTCAADFIFSQFIWIEPYEIRTSDTEFFRCGI